MFYLRVSVSSGGQDSLETASSPLCLPERLKRTSAIDIITSLPFMRLEKTAPHAMFCLMKSNKSKKKDQCLMSTLPAHDHASIVRNP